MLNKNEIFAILSITLVLGTILSLLETWELFFISCGIVLAVILINTVAKKVLAFAFDSEIEVHPWEWRRFFFITKKRAWGHRPHQRLKSMFPAGFFFPLIIKFLSVGLMNWMACLTFEVKGTIYRTARRWGLYQYSEVTENEMAWLAFAGIMANVFFAIIGYLINAPYFAKINLVYAFYNSIPISNLDGSKMLFGKKELWWTSAIITSIGLVLSMVII